MTFKLSRYRALEHEEQTALFAWAKVEARRDPRLELLYAVPNGTGMKAGVPDICLPVPAHGFHGLYIELKRTGGTPCDVKPEQSRWLERLNLQHYRAVVAYGWEDAMNYIQQYLEAT